MTDFNYRVNVTVKMPDPASEDPRVKQGFVAIKISDLPRQDNTCADWISFKHFVDENEIRKLVAQVAHQSIGRDVAAFLEREVDTHYEEQRALNVAWADKPDGT